MRVLFLGDSITDGCRDYRNYHNMGASYPKYASEAIAAALPDVEFEFINLGIGGNRSDQLFDRLFHDGVELQPDFVSVFVGINDIWHRHHHHIATTNEQIAANYKAILARLKNETNAKMLVLTPYLLDCDDKEEVRKDLPSVIALEEKILADYADAYVPLGKLFDEAVKTQPEPHFYSADGVHPNENGARFIAEQYVKAALPILKKLAKK